MPGSLTDLQIAWDKYVKTIKQLEVDYKNAIAPAEKTYRDGVTNAWAEYLRAIDADISTPTRM